MNLRKYTAQQLKDMNLYIPMTFDPVFKKIWGDVEHPKRTAFLLSKFINIPYKDICQNLHVVESEKRKTNFDEMDQRLDLYVKIMQPIIKINIELNIYGNYDIGIVTRNATYAFNLASSGLQNKDAYKNLDETIQINFSDFSINPNKVIETFYLQDEENYKFTDKIKIMNINIAKCYNIYYNETMEGYSDFEKDIIKIGALIVETDRNTLKKCLEDMNMEEEVKGSIINDMDNLSEDRELVNFFNYKKDAEMLKNDQMITAEEKGIKEGIEKGSKQKAMEIAHNLIQQNVDLDIIMKSTGLTKEEINNLS